MKKKIIIIACIILTILLISMLTVYFFTKNEEQPKNEIKSKYNEQATSVMKELNLYDEINEKEYSKTIEIMLEENKFETKYLNNYYEIEYVDNNDFTNNINNLLDINYTSEEINYIFSKFNDNLNILLNMKHINILDFKDLTNFNSDYLERYLSYIENNDYDIKDAITYVNIGLDLKGYSKYDEYTSEQALNDLTILVNKYHKLPDDYEPDDLVSLSYNSNYKLRKEAAAAFEELTSAAIIDNVIFYPFSVYRSFETQNILYNRYKARDGEEQADTYSARPGFSEHQLGLAVDVRSNTLNDNLTSSDYKWMLNNSYKYGFIVRYPKGKQYITQFVEEPWHLRFLGVELATKVHDSGLTYDEYYDLYIKSYN